MSLSCNVICVISMWWLNELQLLLCSVIFDEVTTFFLRGRNPYRHQVTYGGGGQRRGSARLQLTKTSTMTDPAFRPVGRALGTGASDTPGPSRAQNASSPEPPAVWFPYRTAWRSRGAGCPRRLPRPRRSILSGWELRTLALSAATFRSTTCSQKEVTALLPLSLANSAARIAGGERSHPISAMRPRRGRAHAGQNSNVCCAESTLASQWWQRAVASFLIRCKYSPKHPYPVITCVTL